MDYKKLYTALVRKADAALTAYESAPENFRHTHAAMEQLRQALLDAEDLYIDQSEKRNAEPLLRDEAAATASTHKEENGMLLSIDEVNDYLDDLADSFPEALFDGLNGGINLLEEALPDPEFPEGEMYILGEYCDDLLGNYINLYYGSFAALAEKEDWDRPVWEEELRVTLSHELTHHMENRGGLHALDDRDDAELDAWREEFGING